MYRHMYYVWYVVHIFAAMYIMQKGERDCEYANIRDSWIKPRKNIGEIEWRWGYHIDIGELVSLEKLRSNIERYIKWNEKFGAPDVKLKRWQLNKITFL